MLMFRETMKFHVISKGYEILHITLHIKYYGYK